MQAKWIKLDLGEPIDFKFSGLAYQYYKEWCHNVHHYTDAIIYVKFKEHILLDLTSVSAITVPAIMMSILALVRFLLNFWVLVLNAQLVRYKVSDLNGHFRTEKYRHSHDKCIIAKYL